MLRRWKRLHAVSFSYHVSLTPSGLVNITGCSVHIVCVSLPEGMNQLRVGSMKRLTPGENLYCTPTLRLVCHWNAGVK